MLWTECDTAMLKAVLTSRNLSGPLAAKDICVTLHIPTVSRDKHKVDPTGTTRSSNLCCNAHKEFFLFFISY